MAVGPQALSRSSQSIAHPESKAPMRLYPDLLIQVVTLNLSHKASWLSLRPGRNPAKRRSADLSDPALLAQRSCDVHLMLTGRIHLKWGSGKPIAEGLTRLSPPGRQETPSE
ncbi:hypothetical protein KTAU_08690 [Thermogemmatispora aurantia]|uniref:Uncharacterized protein n=1 Tax=Thermogemmatispora aurantia TaxID=2045279 RepID=A0A5J4K667_9CHLR|nr:hypothetical protein KTAU_08690 [Thermogemmatispora aurantia]